MTERRTVPTFCALCVSRCGAVATVEDGRFVSLKPDRSHPTGQALCMKGKVAPEIVHHPDRLLYPLKRTRPKGDADPGWERISWEEALETTAARIRALASTPESLAFSAASPSTSALSDSIDWIDRLRRAIGTPNLCGAVELCAWGRYFASSHTFGAPLPGMYMPDLEHAGCILFWGYNPSVARIAHATAAVAALGRGARLVVVDPRKAGLANRADAWLRVRPGTDAALALAITHVMIERGWYDEAFVREWTNAPFLVRSDDRRLLRESDLSASGDPERLVAWDAERGRPVVIDPARGEVDGGAEGLSLFGEMSVSTLGGAVTCRPVMQLVADGCARYEPDVAESITGVAADAIERAARLLWESRPVALYFWSGIEQHTGTSQIARAICQLYALTGNVDQRGGNVLFPSVPSNPIAGRELLSPEQADKAVGLPAHPIGPSTWQMITSDDLYSAALDARPYRIRALIGFGANLLVGNADTARGRAALAALDFYAHADVFMTPTAQMADIVLPVATPFETEALRIGFEISTDAQSLVQLRKPVVPARGESRSDLQIVFDLATRLGLGHHFWDGDIEAAFAHQLEPSGVSVDALRAAPEGVRVPLAVRHEKHAERVDGVPRGFRTPSRKVELYSETLLDHGHPPLPEFAEPAMSPRANPQWAERYPLVLTCAKNVWFCETQHRQIAGLRSRAPNPEVEIHPEAAKRRGIGAADWVAIETPFGRVRARAKLNPSLHPDVVCGQHGWWQACEEIGAPGYDPFGPDGANLNLLVRHHPSDPMSGSVPHRSYLCEVTRLSDSAADARAG